MVFDPVVQLVSSPLIDRFVFRSFLGLCYADNLVALRRALRQELLQFARDVLPTGAKYMYMF